MERLVSTSHEQLVPSEVEFPTRRLRVLLPIQLAAGIVAVMANIAAIVLAAGSSYVSYGIWTGILYIVTASYGLAAIRTKKVKTVSVFFTLTCVLFFLFIAPVFTWAIAGISQDVGREARWWPQYDPHHYKIYRVLCNGIMILSALVVLVTSLWSGIITWIFINTNYLSMESPERIKPRTPLLPGSEWYLLTLPSGEQQVVHCSQIGLLHGEAVSVKVFAEPAVLSESDRG